MEVTLTEILRRSFDFGMQEIYTAIPCVILSIDYQDNRVDVQPLIELLSEAKVSTPRPPILAVPIVFPSSSSAAITFPLNIGDSVLCVFSQASMDGFRLSTGQPTTPTDFRKFDKRDAIAIPGLTPFAKSVNKTSKRTLAHNPRDVVVVQNLGKGNETELRLTEGGNVIINSPASVIVNAQQAVVNCPSTTWNGNITMNGDYTMNGTLTLDGVVVNGHTHGGVAGGNSRTAGMD